MRPSWCGPGRIRTIDRMRYQSSVRPRCPWIPSEAVTGAIRSRIFELGVTHYDEPPPDALADLGELAGGRPVPLRQPPAGLGRGRSTGRIVDAGYGDDSGGLDGRHHRPPGGPLRPPSRRPGSPTCARPGAATGPLTAFVHTAGGRTALPGPAPVSRPPFVRLQAPLVWTTLALTLHADGRAEYAVAGASRSPGTGSTTPTATWRARSGVTDFRGWYARSARAATRRGATRTPRPWSPRSRPRWSANCPASSCAAAPSRRAHPGGRRRRWPRRASRGDQLYLVLDGVLGGRGRRPGGGRGAARVRCWASGPCSRAAGARPPCGASPPCGWPRPGPRRWIPRPWPAGPRPPPRAGRRATRSGPG